MHMSNPTFSSFRYCQESVVGTWHWLKNSGGTNGNGGPTSTAGQPASSHLSLMVLKKKVCGGFRAFGNHRWGVNKEFCSSVSCVRSVCQVVSSGYFTNTRIGCFRLLSKCCCFFTLTRNEICFHWALFFCLFFLCPLTAQNVSGVLWRGEGGSAERKSIHTFAKTTNYLHDYSAKHFKTIKAKSTWPLWMRKYTWPYYNVHEHSANSHDMTQTCAKTNYLHDCSAKSSWPLYIYPHDHYAKYRWPFYEIRMTTLQIHRSILQNSHDITQTCAKSDYLHDYYAKSSWPLCICPHDHYAKYRWPFYKIHMTSQMHRRILQVHMRMIT